MSKTLEIAAANSLAEPARMLPVSERTSPATEVDPARHSKKSNREYLVNAAKLLLCSVLLAAIPAGVPDSVDAGARLQQARAVVEHASLAIPVELVGNSHDGLYRTEKGIWYSKYGIGLSLAWVLPVAVANGVARLTGLPVATLAGFAIGFVNPLVMAATVVLLWSILKRMSVPPAARLFSVAVFVLGNMTLPYANSCWSEPLAGLLILGSVAWPLLSPNSRKSAFFSGLLVTAATLVKPEMVLLGLPLLWLFRSDWRRAMAFCMGGCWGPLVILLLNAVMTGSPLKSPYSNEASQFEAPWNGIGGFLAEGERNILLFLPGIVMGLIAWICVPRSSPLRSGRATALGVFGIYFLLYACWHNWWGGLCFGPRFLYPLAAVAALPVGPVLWNWMSRATGRNWLPRAVTGVLAIVLLTGLPLQVAGMSVKDHQAVAVSEVTHQAQWISQVKLLSLKARHGWRSPELYLKSEFVSLAQGEPDLQIDHRKFYTYQSYNHWWSLLLANRVRQNRSPLKTL